MIVAGPKYKSSHLQSSEVRIDLSSSKQFLCIQTITAEARAQQSEKNTVDQYVMVKYDDLVSYCNKFCFQLYADTSTSGKAKIFKLNDDFPPEFKNFLLINHGFHAEAYHGRMEVVMEDIVSGFTNTLRGFWQAELILDRLENIV